MKQRAGIVQKQFAAGREFKVSSYIKELLFFSFLDC